MDGISDDGRVACTACGTLHVAASGLLSSLREDVDNLERELRGKRSQIKKLRAEQDASLRTHPLYGVANRVLERWRTACSPKTKELAGKRLEYTIARLKGGYNEEDLNECVDGYAAFPYVSANGRSASGRPAQRFVDAELIFRSARHVDQGITLAKQTREYSQVLQGTGPAPLVSDVEGLSEIGGAALRYAQFGWHVFPCQPGAKIPATRNGLLDATDDPSVVATYWQRHPTANVAVRCGKDSGIVVLDVDGDIGFESLRDLEGEHSVLPVTASVKTPHGGSHFYFQHPGVDVHNTQGVPAVGLDIRGDGGYVLAATSVIEDKAYTVDESAPVAPMPAWLITLLQDHQKATRERPPDYWGDAVERGAKQGERNGALASYVGRLVGLGMSMSEALAHARLWNESRVKPPLSLAEVTRTVDSVFRTDERNRRRDANT